MLAERIRELRQKKNLTQKDIADKLIISHQTVGSWERGRTEPSSDALKELATIFDVSIDYLLGNESSLDTDDIKQARHLRNIATHLDSDITEEEMNEILSFIDFIKQRDANKSK